MTMLMRRLGRTGLKVAAFCLGGNTFGWTTDQAASEAVLDAYLEAGGNFVDTADVYSRYAPGNVGGESETVIGQWLKARGNRARVVLATKVNAAMGDGPNERGLSRQHIMDGVEASLRRLQTDHIDLYQAHADEPDAPPLEETLRAFDDLVRQGKVRYIGCSNHRAYRLAKALAVSDRHDLARYESLQPKYNLFFRDEYERELEPLCREEEVGVISYSSLGSGFFSGKYRAGTGWAGRCRPPRAPAASSGSTSTSAAGASWRRSTRSRRSTARRRPRSRWPGSSSGPASRPRSRARPRPSSSGSCSARSR
jgi:aryl-alcohol dehydrogenase-like predicted oxidoreductase